MSLGHLDTSMAMEGRRKGEDVVDGGDGWRAAAVCLGPRVYGGGWVTVPPLPERPPRSSPAENWLKAYTPVLRPQAGLPTHVSPLFERPSTN